MDLKTLLQQLERTQWEKRPWPTLKGPILTRYDLQTLTPPQGDFVSKTSGSTGIPVEVQRTNLSKLWTTATNLREIFWHKRDLSQSFAIIRPSIHKEVHEEQWGPVFKRFGKTGPSYGHPVNGDLNAWLQKIQPGYLMTFPSILDTLDLKALPNLKGIKTTGETLHHRHPLVVDMYSSEEVGTIAIQCPDNPEAYHVMENILVEILDENNQPADVGRVILTDLTSRYLHRYEIGDHAERGTCHCGRGLQTLKKILGRTRNQVLLPDGTRQWPRIGSLAYRTIAPIKRFQMAQIGPTTLELRHIIETPLTESDKEKLTHLIHSWIHYPFEIRFTQVEDFPKGKFEEFVNVYAKSLADNGQLIHS
jgi:phenylacetate-CoA ligase